MAKRSRAAGVPLYGVVTVAMVAVTIFFIRSASHFRTASSSRTGSASGVSLVTDEDLGGGALQYTRLNFQTAGATATPEVVLVRDLKAEDLLSIGVCPNVDTADPRYKIVVVRGDLDLGNIRGMSQVSEAAQHTRYMVYVYDAAEGSVAPTAYYSSRNGGILRQLLGNPNLPDDVPPGSPAGTRQVDMSITAAQCPPVQRSEHQTAPGAVEPTVAPGVR